MRQLLFTIAFTDRREAATGSFLPPVGDWDLVNDTDEDAAELRELTYAAALTDAEYGELVREWSLDESDAVPSLGAIGDWGDGLPRHLAGGSVFDLEPMDWNIGGITPVAEARLWVSEHIDIR